MPFKDPKKRQEYNRRYQKQHYQNNKDKHKTRVRQRKRQIRAWFDDLKRKLACEVCGISGEDCPWILEFHHHDESEKRDLITYMVSNGYSKKRILKEIDKCRVLCSNHHRQLHYEEKQAGGSPKPGDEWKESASRRHEKNKRRLFREKRRRMRKKDEKGGE